MGPDILNILLGRAQIDVHDPLERAAHRDSEVLQPAPTDTRQLREYSPILGHLLQNLGNPADALIEILRRVLGEPLLHARYLMRAYSRRFACGVS